MTVGRVDTQRFRVMEFSTTITRGPWTGRVDLIVSATPDHWIVRASRDLCGEEWCQVLSDLRNRRETPARAPATHVM